MEQASKLSHKDAKLIQWLQGKAEKEKTMEKKICVRCDKEYTSSGFMWDFQKKGKQYICEIVCQECDKEMNPNRYKEDNKDKQIAELQEKLAIANNRIAKAIDDYDFIYKALQNSKDVIHRRNLQIADLKKKLASKIYEYPEERITSTKLLQEILENVIGKVIRSISKEDIQISYANAMKRWEKYD